MAELCASAAGVALLAGDEVASGDGVAMVVAAAVTATNGDGVGAGAFDDCGVEVITAALPAGAGLEAAPAAPGVAIAPVPPEPVAADAEPEGAPGAPKTAGSVYVEFPNVDVNCDAA